MANKRERYQFGDEVYQITELRSGWMVKCGSATMGGPYPTASAARQNLLADLRTRAAHEKAAALAMYESAAQRLWRLGTDVSGLHQFMIQ